MKYGRDRGRRLAASQGGPGAQPMFRQALVRPPTPDFGPLAAGYDRFRPTDDNWWELFEVLVDEGDLVGRRVLDVGCGTGRLAAAIAERGARVWGVDPSEQMLRQARANASGKAAFKEGRAEALPFKDGWFDRAVLRLVVHLVDRPRALREVARVLGPGGRIVIATFAPSSLEDFWVARVFPEVVEIDRRRFPDQNELADELCAAGFANIRFRRLAQNGRLARAEALERIRGRYISTLQLLSEQALAEGLARAERELPNIVEDEREWLVVVADRR
jgi:ubiquinone/menaquinone biosynthesis C-methylase UbiE